MSKKMSGINIDPINTVVLIAIAYFGWKAYQCFVLGTCGGNDNGSGTGSGTGNTNSGGSPGTATQPAVTFPNISQNPVNTKPSPAVNSGGYNGGGGITLSDQTPFSKGNGVFIEFNSDPSVPQVYSKIGTIVYDLMGNEVYTFDTANMGMEVTYVTDRYAVLYNNATNDDTEVGYVNFYDVVRLK